MSWKTVDLNNFNTTKINMKFVINENRKKEEVEINVCEKCKGTGILDFEFYTRSCECKLQ